MKNSYDQLMEMVIESNGKTNRQNFLESYNCSNLKVYADDQNAYMVESDIFDFMKDNRIYSVTEAENIIAKIKSIDENSLILMEAAPEKEAMSLKQAQKYYDKIINASLGKAGTIAEIDDRIKALKSAVKKMEDSRDHKLGAGDHVEYILKDLIPFNSFARLVSKYHDAYGFLGDLANGIIPGASLVIRAATYKQMLNDNIKKTNKAIEFLEEKKKNLK